jgi:periplasmic protein TonB
MLAYAANRPVVVDRRPHPNTLLMIIGVHVALAAVVMSAKMDFPVRPKPVITKVDFIPLPKEPQPPVARTKTEQPLPPRETWIDHPPSRVPTDPIDLPPIDSRPPINTGSLGGSGTVVIPEIPRAAVTPLRTGARLLTPESELKPPYPAAKLVTEEEGAVTVRLTINELGRVVAVDPVGRADAAFLEAARRHLLAHWRFKPATEDGHPVTSTSVVTLQFRLDG